MKPHLFYSNYYSLLSNRFIFRNAKIEGGIGKAVGRAEIADADEHKIKKLDMRLPQKNYVSVEELIDDKNRIDKIRYFAEEYSHELLSRPKLFKEFARKADKLEDDIDKKAQKDFFNFKTKNIARMMIMKFEKSDTIFLKKVINTYKNEIRNNSFIRSIVLKAIQRINLKDDRYFKDLLKKMLGYGYADDKAFSIVIINKINDQKYLKNLFVNSGDYLICFAAMKRITDRNFLNNIANNSNLKPLTRLLAMYNNKVLLKEYASRYVGAQEILYEMARDRLKEIDSGKDIYESTMQQYIS